MIDYSTVNRKLIVCHFPKAGKESRSLISKRISHSPLPYRMLPELSDIWQLEGSLCMSQRGESVETLSEKLLNWSGRAYRSQDDLVL